MRLNRYVDLWLLGQREKKAKLRRQFTRYKRHHNRYGEAPFLVNRHNQNSIARVRGGMECVLPEHLNLDENYEETVTHFTNVRRGCERKFRLRSLVFDNIKTISPAGAVLLASEIDRWNDTVGRRLKAKHEKWNPAVKQLLGEMGFFELIHINRPAEIASVTNTKFLPFIRGDVEDTKAGGAPAKRLRQKIESAAGQEIRSHLLYDGLSEAITNVAQHAYPENLRGRAKHQPWWMFAAYIAESHTVVVCFYDHGRTIPGTLPASKKFEKIRDKIGLWDDGKRIEAAMRLGRSSSGMAGRGRGLQNFLEIIKHHEDSRLRIFSNHGVLTVSHVPGKELVFDSRTVENSLKGTLIEWQFMPTKDEKNENQYRS